MQQGDSCLYDKHNVMKPVYGTRAETFSAPRTSITRPPQLTSVVRTFRLTKTHRPQRHSHRKTLLTAGAPLPARRFLSGSRPLPPQSRRPHNPARGWERPGGRCRYRAGFKSPAGADRQRSTACRPPLSADSGVGATARCPPEPPSARRQRPVPSAGDGGWRAVSPPRCRREPEPPPPG